MNTRQYYHIVRVGVTGGIGAGKSTVCNLFASHGRLVISADHIARSITDTDPSVRSRIQKEFGPATYLPNGQLNRKEIAAIVFSDKRKLAKLNAIVHPAVFAAIDQQLERATAGSVKPYVVIEAALIFESGMESTLDYVIVVTADTEKSLMRVMQRDGLTREEVQRRMENQIPQEKKVRMADFVIKNDGTVESLAATVDFLDGLFIKTIAKGTE
jgi:dephospho-CoA kinase